MLSFPWLFALTLGTTAFASEIPFGRMTGESLVACNINEIRSEFLTQKRDENFAARLENFDLNSPALALSNKTTGTSLGIVVEERSPAKKKIGKWLPRNAAADPEAQVVSYQLGRFLQMNELVTPSAYLTARGNALATFRKWIEGRQESNSLRQLNRSNLLSDLRKNPGEMAGAYMLKLHQEEYADLVNAAANTINGEHPLAIALRAGSPPPSRERKIAFRVLRDRDDPRMGIPSNSELELARQLSKIFVLDILTGQWDRFSGGNLEVARGEEGKAIFVARDNGGATLKTGQNKALAKYSGIVNRFDRGQIHRVERLVELLNVNPACLGQALEMQSSPNNLLVRATAFLEFVKKTVRTYGENRVFFPD